MHVMQQWRNRRRIRPPRRRRLKAVAVFPTLLTLGNLICGFAAIHFCMRAMYAFGAVIDPSAKLTLNTHLMERMLPSFLAISAGLIFLGMVFDMFDGWVARLTQRTGDFGGQLDSLADVITFGAAPSLLVIALVTTTFAPSELNVSPLASSLGGRFNWVMAALYTACAALRLARFNVENEEAESAHSSFKGLPSPGAAALIASLVILHEHLKPDQILGVWLVWMMPAITAAAGLLMVSRINYVHFANNFLRGRRSFRQVVVMFLVLAAFIAQPPLTLATFVVLYVASGPAIWLWRRRPTRARPRADAAASPAGERGTVRAAQR